MKVAARSAEVGAWDEAAASDTGVSTAGPAGSLAVMASAVMASEVSAGAAASDMGCSAETAETRVGADKAQRTCMAVCA